DPDAPVEDAAEHIPQYVDCCPIRAQLLQQPGLPEELVGTDSLLLLPCLHSVATAVTTNREGDPAGSTQLQRVELDSSTCLCVTGFRTDIKNCHVRRPCRVHHIEQRGFDVMVSTHGVGWEKLHYPCHFR